MISDAIASHKNYSYVNSRVRARRANLVTDAEYRKLAKMELSGIAEFLGKRGYDTEIEELGADYEGEELLEKALRQNLARTYRELMAMSPAPVQELLAIYFKKFDIENVKIIIRAKLKGGEVSDMLVPTREMDRKELERLEEMDTVEEVLDAFKISGFNGDIDVSGSDDMGEVEDALDVFYYTNLVDRVEEAGGKSTLFREFLETEAVLKNVSLVLRMKRRGNDYREIADRLIPVPRRKSIDPEELASLNTVEEVMERLEDSPVGRFIESENPAEVQRALEKYKLKQGIKLMHEDPLGVNPVLGFMVCKEVEVKNLRMLTRSKQEGLDEEFIKRNLVKGVAS